MASSSATDINFARRPFRRGGGFYQRSAPLHRSRHTYAGLCDRLKSIIEVGLCHCRRCPMARYLGPIVSAGLWLLFSLNLIQLLRTGFYEIMKSKMLDSSLSSGGDDRVKKSSFGSLRSVASGFMTMVEVVWARRVGCHRTTFTTLPSGQPFPLNCRRQSVTPCQAASD